MYYSMNLLLFFPYFMFVLRFTLPDIIIWIVQTTQCTHPLYSAYTPIVDYLFIDAFCGYYHINDDIEVDLLYL
jgi:hypothetical protein